ncbi:hypothetical protein HYZ98_04865 [Candidatus Peregrinibacteria bacterium]|nr:hypothetical protein [Candidatus Peregrinibacteria bacterium]
MESEAQNPILDALGAPYSKRVGIPFPLPKGAEHFGSAVLLAGARILDQEKKIGITQVVRGRPDFECEMVMSDVTGTVNKTADQPDEKTGKIIRVSTIRPVVAQEIRACTKQQIRIVFMTSDGNLDPNSPRTGALYSLQQAGLVGKGPDVDDIDDQVVLIRLLGKNHRALKALYAITENPERIFAMGNGDNDHMMFEVVDGAGGVAALVEEGEGQGNKKARPAATVTYPNPETALYNARTPGRLSTLLGR